MMEYIRNRIGESSRGELLLTALRSEPGKKCLRLAGLTGGCFLLAAARIVGSPLPLAACVVMLAGAWSGSLAALLGAGGGYILLWGWEAAMEPLALSLSFLAAAIIFRNTPISKSVLSAGLTAAVGAVFLLDTGITLSALANRAVSVLLAWAAPILWARAGSELRARQICGVLLLGCLAATVPPLGYAAAAAVAFGLLNGGGSLLWAVTCGVALDLGGVPGVPATGALALGALICQLKGLRQPLNRGAVFAASVGFWQLLIGQFSPALSFGAVVGLGLGLLLPSDLMEPMSGLTPEPAQPGSLPPQRGVEKALETMYGVLARESPEVTPEKLASVYDFASEQVCRCCVRRAQCWEQEAEDTYRDLCTAGEAILLRGTALREDLPERFSGRCRHTEGFLTAVNQALDAQRVGRREERRAAEDRQIAASQYLFLARLLHRASEPGARTPIRFAPELAVGTARRRDSPVSGDRGATCKDRFGNFYVLLCDGMGTGGAARTESDRAARLLTALLEAGVAADSAMELLNGFYVLRRDTVFSTVDLLQLSLYTGEGTLYKWGAAPSYLEAGGAVQKIGTVTPPPGCGVGEAHSPGRYALSLKEGETLVMVSDGAYGEETEQKLTEVSRGTVRDLASCLITLGDADGADDRTAIVLRLRPENLKTA